MESVAKSDQLPGISLDNANAKTAFIRLYACVLVCVSMWHLQGLYNLTHCQVQIHKSSAIDLSHNIKTIANGYDRRSNALLIVCSKARETQPPTSVYGINQLIGSLAVFDRFNCDAASL